MIINVAQTLIVLVGKRESLQNRREIKIMEKTTKTYILKIEIKRMRPEREIRIHIIGKGILLTVTVAPSCLVYSHSRKNELLEHTCILLISLVHLHVLLEQNRPDIGILLLIAVNSITHRSSIIKTELSLNNTLEFPKNIILKHRYSLLLHVLFLSHAPAIDTNDTVILTPVCIIDTLTTHVTEIL